MIRELKINFKQILTKYLKGNKFLLVLFFAYIFLYAISNIISPSARSLDNLIIVISRTAIIGIAAFGNTFPLATGGVDISSGSIIGFSAVLTVLLSNGNVSLPLVLLAGVVSGLVFGAINGVIVAKLKVFPFITTLAMMSFVRGLIFVTLESRAGGGFISAMNNRLFIDIYDGKLGFIPNPIIYIIIFLILFSMILNRTKIGTYILSIGGNREAASLAGIKVERVEITAYMLSGLAAGIAGIILGARTGLATKDVGSGLELLVLTAAILGGTPIGGGRATIFGAFLGALILESLTNTLHLMNIAGFYEFIFKGCILLIAVYLTNFALGKKELG